MDDQSDLIWCEATHLDDGTYQSNVYASDFNFKTGTYNIHVYAIRSDGTQDMICGTEGEIS